MLLAKLTPGSPQPMTSDRITAATWDKHVLTATRKLAYIAAADSNDSLTAPGSAVKKAARESTAGAQMVELMGWHMGAAGTSTASLSSLTYRGVNEWTGEAVLYGRREESAAMLVMLVLLSNQRSRCTVVTWYCAAMLK